MNRWRERHTWLAPTLVAFLSAGLGIAVNYATGSASSWIWWVVVGVLVLAVTSITAVTERRKASHSAAARAIFTTSPTGESSEVIGVVMRESETITTPDGTKTIVESFS